MRPEDVGRPIKKGEQKEHFYSALGIFKKFWGQTTSVIVFIILVIILALIIIRIRPTIITNPDINIVELDEFEAAFEGAVQKEIFDMRAQDLYIESHLPGAKSVVNERCNVYGVVTCGVGMCESPGVKFFYSDHGEDYHEVRTAIEKSPHINCWGKIYLLDGGFKDWAAAGNTVVK